MNRYKELKISKKKYIFCIQPRLVQIIHENYPLNRFEIFFKYHVKRGEEVSNFETKIFRANSVAWHISNLNINVVSIESKRNNIK